MHHLLAGKLEHGAAAGGVAGEGVELGEGDADVFGEGHGLGGGDEMDAGEEMECVGEFLGFFRGREVSGERGYGVWGPETDEARVVVCAPAAVEGGEVDLLGDGAEGCWEGCVAGGGSDDALGLPVSCRLEKEQGQNPPCP